MFNLPLSYKCFLQLNLKTFINYEITFKTSDFFFLHKKSKRPIKKKIKRKEKENRKKKERINESNNKPNKTMKIISHKKLEN